jgi:hypothetical protein
MRLLVHITTGPENPTRLALGLLVARTALAEGHEVDVFLAGDGVLLLDEVALSGLEGKGTGNIRTHLMLMAATSRSRWPKSRCRAICSGTSCSGSIDCDDSSRQWSERREETREFGGEVCPDEAKSTWNRTPHAAGPPYPVPLAQEDGPWFPRYACSAIILGQMVGAIWGMSAQLPEPSHRTVRWVLEEAAMAVVLIVEDDLHDWGRLNF